MHILAEHYRAEFLASPQLVRIDHSVGANGYEPTFLVKGSTLLLKYMVLGARLALHLGCVDGRLVYALEVYDDVLKPVILWSIVESEAEVKALQNLVVGEVCPIFLFNELALNVAGATFHANFDVGAQDLVSSATLGKVNYDETTEQVNDFLEQVFQGGTAANKLYSADVALVEVWNPVRNHFITSHATDSPIDLFNLDEGAQQEHLAVWLTDSLQPLGVHHSPQIPKGGGRRELTDILISYDHGAFLVESKTIALLNREALPDRATLTKDVSQHVSKAVRQLRGAVRRIKNGVSVTTLVGAPIDVEKSWPLHAIVLIPEFSLIENKYCYGSEFITDFMGATGGFIHLLDLAELLRVVQAAEMISDRGTEITPLMAFDYCLMERAQRARDAGTLCIQVLLRFEE